MLNRDTQVTRIGEVSIYDFVSISINSPRHFDLIRMQMTMHVDLETFSHTVRVQRDMAQNELIHKHTNTM